MDGGVFDLFGSNYILGDKNYPKKAENVGEITMKKNRESLISTKTIYALLFFMVLVTSTQVKLLEPYRNNDEENNARIAITGTSLLSQAEIIRGWKSFTEVKSNIAIVTSWPDDLPTSEEKMDDQTIQLMCKHYNRLAYARFHKYEYGIVATELTNAKYLLELEKAGNPSLHKDWFNLFMLRELLSSPSLLGQHEWVWYMSNHIVMNQIRISVEEIIGNVSPTTSIILRGDDNMWDDTNMFLLRNTEFTRVRFLERIWALRGRYSQCLHCAIHVVFQELLSAEEVGPEPKIFTVSPDAQGQKCCEPILQHQPNAPNQHCLRNWVVATNAKDRNVYPNIQWSLSFPTFNTLFPAPPQPCSQLQLFPVQSFTLLPTDEDEYIRTPYAYERPHMISISETNNCILERSVFN